MKKVAKLSPALLQKLIIEEAAKIRKAQALTEVDDLETVESHADDAEELDDAGDYADTLEKQIDFYKANKIKEEKLLSQLRVLREQTAAVKRKIAKKL